MKETPPTRLARRFIASEIIEVKGLDGQARDAVIEAANRGEHDDHPRADHCLAVAVRRLSGSRHGGRVIA